MPERLTCEEVSNCFIRSPAVINQEICNRSVEYHRHWFDMVPQGNYAWGEGYEKTKYTFRGGMVPHDLEWKEVQEERAPGTLDENDPGHNPCDYDAHLVTYGLESEAYRAFHTHLRTNKFCLDGMLHKHLLRQQFGQMVDAFTRTTVGVWEAAHKLFYLRYCDIYVATEDPTSFLATKHEPTGLDDLFPSISGIKVMPLSMGHLECLYDHMMHDIPQFGVSYTDGLPDFGVSTSPQTIRTLYAQSPEDFDVLKRTPDNKLLDGYGFTYSRKHFVMMGDMRAIRLNETTPGSGTLQKVFNEELQQHVCGDSPFASETYSRGADFEVTIVMLKKGSVVKVNIPVPETMFQGGAEFGERNYVGNFSFFRPPADCGTEKQNYGWWFSEFFGEPEPGCARAAAIIHRTCKPTRFEFGECDPCPPDPCPETPAAQPDAVVVGGQPTQLDVNLDSALPSAIAGPLPVGTILAFTLQNGDVEAGTVIDNASDPVHRFQFETDATEFASAGSNPIVTTTNPGLPACGLVCLCRDVTVHGGNTTDLEVEFEDGAIDLGVGTVGITVTFVDGTTDTADITAIVAGITGPRYTLQFAADVLCTDNEGVESVGTCP